MDELEFDVYPQSQPVVTSTSTGSPTDESASNNNINNTSIQSYVTAKVNDIINSGTFSYFNITQNRHKPC